MIDICLETIPILKIVSKLFGNIWILFEIVWKQILIITLLGIQLNIFMMLWIGASLNSGIQISSCLIWIIYHTHINTKKKCRILALIVLKKSSVKAKEFHILGLIQKKTFWCSYCRKTFSNAENVKKHWRTQVKTFYFQSMS